MIRSAFLAVSVIVVVSLSPPLMKVIDAAGNCVLEADSATDPPVFRRHLVGGCTKQERAAQAVAAEEVLAAIQQGRGVDLAGVVLTDDLMLDQLQPVAVAEVGSLSSAARQFLTERHVEQVRMSHVPLMIEDALVRGVVATRLKDSYLVIEGPTRLNRSIFEQTVDLSHVLFLNRVDATDAVFQREAFFIKSGFQQGAVFERTAFGPHTRFHRATFVGPTSFLRSGFNGLAEFLEVSFDQEASFSRTYFKMGTGFSGSRFGAVLDFSEALFEREVYFLFTVFDADAYFRRSTFKSVADFSDAQFNGLADFSKVYFRIEPTFARARLAGEPPRRSGLQNPVLLYGIVISLVVFTVLFVLALRKR